MFYAAISLSFKEDEDKGPCINLIQLLISNAKHSFARILEMKCSQ